MGSSSLLQFLVCLMSLSCTDLVSSQQQNVGANKTVQDGSVFIDGRVAIGSTDSDFICATLDWWPPEKCDYGTCAWGLVSLLNLDLNNPILLNAVKAFSPLKLRLGGTLQDLVIYDVGDPHPRCEQFRKNTSDTFGFSGGCLHMSRWDELNSFFEKAGAKIIFGLNALNGRNINPDKSATGPWNSSNAASFMRYTVNKGYSIYAWELGNELSGTGVGLRVAAGRYASDVIELHSVINDVYSGFKTKPLTIAPGGFFTADWYKELVDKSKNKLDVVTHHIYNLGPGVDEHLIDKILDPSYLDGEAKTFSSLESIVNSSNSSATAWVGEAGGAYNSGHHLVSNAFVYSFWYLDQLGMSATYDTKTYCRQSLIGGNYGLLNTTTYAPNPDYYSALLWNRLMGKTVLKTSFVGTKKIRHYSHCAKNSQGVMLLLMNLDGNTTVKVHVTSQTIAPIKTWRHHHHKHPETRFARMPRQAMKVPSLRQEYHLTAKDENLHSQIMLLNGKPLAVNSSGAIPPLEPISINPSEPITVAPYSIVFAHLPDIEVPACN